MFSGEKRVFVDTIKSYVSFHSNNTAKFEPKQAPYAIEYVENINCLFCILLLVLMKS